MAFEYIVDGKRITLPINPNKIAVRFKESIDTFGRSSAINEKSEVGSFEDRLEVPNETITIVDVKPTLQQKSVQVAGAARALDADPAVEQVLPVFDLGTKQVVPTDRIIVGIKPESEERGKGIVNGIKGEIVQSKWNEYVIRLAPDVNPFDVIADVTKRAEVAFAEPDFVTIGEHTAQKVHIMTDTNPRETEPVEPGSGENGAFAPSEVADSLLSFQYALRITKADQAWNIVTPSPSVNIAILDEGVDINHPDLRAAIKGTYDAIDQNSNQQPNDWDGHGTACAGLAAAIPNNSEGVRGVAGGCSLLAIRIAFSTANGAGWTTTNSQISDGIDWAWQNGADILSNSWGGGAPSNSIISAFERARVQGRSGKGCVIVVAASNSSGPIEFPATLPNVLTVTASNEFDEPKTKTSSDGESWWGSCFGPEADLAAPGVHNYTTDISGDAGYNAGGVLDSNYISNFNGTSSSTPIVAGVAALVLSANPNLEEASVRRLLKETADKVGQVTYIDGRNDQMGHGRVNALRAVQMAPAAI